MARLLRRLGVQISWREIFTRTVYESFWKDNCLSMAAQLAYYFFFALFPTLLFIVALASYFPVTSLIDDMFRTFGGFLPPEALQIITGEGHVRAILFNIFGGITRCDDVANGIVTSLKTSPLSVPLVIRLTGTNEEKARQILKDFGLGATTSMDEAVRMVIEKAQEVPV